VSAWLRPESGVNQNSFAQSEHHRLGAIAVIGWVKEPLYGMMLCATLSDQVGFIWTIRGEKK
jgi:hypothetical protein